LAFRKAIKQDSELYEELFKHGCETMTDVLGRARAQIKWEEHVAQSDSQERRSHRHEEKSKCRADDQGRRSPRPTPYDRCLV
jgi:hypothetical protein